MARLSEIERRTLLTVAKIAEARAEDTVKEATDTRRQFANAPEEQRKLAESIRAGLDNKASALRAFASEIRAIATDPDVLEILDGWESDKPEKV